MTNNSLKEELERNSEATIGQTFILELASASKVGSVAFVGPSNRLVIRIVHFEKFNTASVVSQSVSLPNKKSR